ncbi:hypothetical protein LLE49_06770 [Alicyclobacillus tolerans]|uniref:hypothetical protein n=1 Tax=Alicyclobacillus tolerans TaxID=90970 RepID=UPI001F25B341|nr:hypothetical protein [Alicyclobacillus tolerans]MCF8564448.1 hypothetical protein [Alicyclobacillus tolerans]
MRRYQLNALALILMWIGALEVAASFLAKFWFQYTIQFTPFFFLALLVGIGLYVLARFV